MRIHTLERQQKLRIPLEDAWEFFATPRNLNEITPPDIGFKILSGLPEKMQPGQIFAYKIRLAPLVWTTWVTEITHIEDRRCFVDSQRHGPYKLWVHRHSFEEADGGKSVLMTDHVDYALGFGILGDIAHALFVKAKLRSIFDHRVRVLDEKFNRDS